MALFKDKVAIITGASSGIGAAAVKAFVREGAKVVASDVDEEGGQKVVDEIKNGEVIFVKADVSKPDEQEALVKATEDQFGALHIAFNNAGIVGPVGPVADIDISEWDNVISINLRSEEHTSELQSRGHLVC